MDLEIFSIHQIVSYSEYSEHFQKKIFLILDIQNSIDSYRKQAGLLRNGEKNPPPYSPDSIARRVMEAKSWVTP